MRFTPLLRAGKKEKVTAEMKRAARKQREAEREERAAAKRRDREEIFEVRVWEAEGQQGEGNRHAARPPSRRALLHGSWRCLQGLAACRAQHSKVAKQRMQT